MKNLIDNEAVQFGLERTSYVGSHLLLANTQGGPPPRAAERGEKCDCLRRLLDRYCDFLCTSSDIVTMPKGKNSTKLMLKKHQFLRSVKYSND
jgi:hypothetical protein